ncbi:MAG: two-component regulator propeller domain-containing protein [Bacteroidota bacterium]
MKNIKLQIILIIFFTTLFSCNDNEEDIEIVNEPYDKVINVIYEHNNIVWVGTSSSGLYKLENDTWINYTKSDGLLSNKITSLLIDNNADLWVGTYDGLSKLVNDGWENFTTEEGLYFNHVRSLECDLDNNILIGSGANRITKYDGTSFTYYHVNPEFGGGGGHIHAITCDLEGNLWAGSCMTGLSVFYGSTWYHGVTGTHTSVQVSLCDTSGDVWIGEVMGVYRYSDDTWVQYTEENGLSDTTILSMDIDYLDNIWVGTKNGISKFDGISWTNYAVDNGPINEYVSSLACDQDGTVWVGSNEGLLKFEPN